MEEVKWVAGVTTLFQCRYCGTAFQQTDKLISHKKKNHLLEIIARKQKSNSAFGEASSASSDDKKVTVLVGAPVSYLPVSSTSSLSVITCPSSSTAHDEPEFRSPEGNKWLMGHEKGTLHTGNSENQRISERGSIASADNLALSLILPVHCSIQVPESYSKKIQCSSELPNTLQNNQFLKNSIAPVNLLTLSSKEKKATGVSRPYNARVNCPVCAKRIHGATRLQQHLKSVHRDFKAYQCPDCPYATSNKFSYRSHLLLHSSLNPYKCPYCTATYKTSWNRKQHVRTVHDFADDPEGKTKIVHMKISDFDNTELPRRRASVYPPGYYELLDDKDEEEKSPPNSSSDGNVDITNSFLASTNQRKCLICGKIFSTNRHLESHLRRTHEKPHHCPKCPFKTGVPGALRIHLRIHERDNGRHRCTYCGARFTSHTALFVHKRRIHVGIKSIASPSRSRSRLRVKPSIKESPTTTSSNRITLYSCKHCPYSAYWTTQVEAHEREAHSEIPNEFKCSHCTASFSQQVQLTFHMKWHSSSKNDSSSQSKEKMEGEGGMEIENEEIEDHFEMKPEEESNKLECLECGKICKNKRSFYYHQYYHTSAKRKMCNFLRKSQLRAPMRKPINIAERLKKEKTGKKYGSSIFNFKSCEYCPFKCRNQSRLDSHMNSHQTQNAIKCSLCSASFETTFQHCFHMKWHGVIKPKPLSMVSTTLLPLPTLPTTVGKYFTGIETEKPFTCSFCPFTSKRASGVRDHENVHLHQNKFTCHKCTASYSREFYLEKHITLHDEEYIKHNGKKQRRSPVSENYGVSLGEMDNSYFEGMLKLERVAERSSSVTKTKKQQSTASAAAALIPQPVAFSRRRTYNRSSHCNVCKTSFTSSCDLRRHQTSKYHIRNEEILNAKANMKITNLPCSKSTERNESGSRYFEVRNSEIIGTPTSPKKTIHVGSTHESTQKSVSYENVCMDTRDNDNSDGVVTVTHQSSCGIKITTVRFGN